MRTIKFRVWAKWKMEYQDAMKFFVLPWKEKPNNWGNIEDIMQFTWLTDKNGKEIWEWDIVTSLWTTFIVEYDWDWFYAVNWDEYASLNSYTWLDDPYDIDDAKVIWNIYENTEILSNTK